MKKHFALASVLLLSTLIPGAEETPRPEGARKRPAPCPDLLFEGSRRIMEWEARNEPDSARAVNGSLEKYCGWNEQVLRYRILSDTSASGFKAPEGYADFVLRQLLQYRERRRWAAEERPSFELMGGKYGYWADPDFDAFTRRKAEGMLSRTGSRDQEIFLSLYAEDWDRFESLLKDSREIPDLNREAYRRLQNAHRGPEISASLFLGPWIPTGSLEAVNQHAYPGFRFGLGWNRFGAHFRFGLVIPNGPYRYEVRFQDSLVQADNFGGPSLALEASAALLQSLHWRLNLVGGYGGLWSTAYTVENPDPTGENASKSLSSTEWSLGARLDHLWGTGGVVSLEGKYFFLDVGNRGGTPLDGHAFAILLHIGLYGKGAWMDARQVWK